MQSPLIRQPKSVRVAFAVQNVGGVDFTQDVGDTVVVRQTIQGLRGRGHQVGCLKLQGSRVLWMNEDLDVRKGVRVPASLADNRVFTMFEGGARRVQQKLKLPYLALFDSFRFYQASKEVLTNQDLCHEYHALFSVGCAIACRKLGIPYIVSIPADQLMERKIKGHPLRGVQKWVAILGMRLTLTSAERVICVSEQAKKHFQSSWGVPKDRLVVIPNGVDAELFSASQNRNLERRALGVNGSGVVIFVGHFQAWHGLEALLEAFHYSLGQVPTAQLILVGDGPTRSQLEKQISALGLGNSVRITGLVPKPTVAKMLSAADVAVLPYPEFKQELWFSPLKLYEYMAAGKAIVASRAGQIKDVIQDGENGVLVEPGDTIGLGTAISQLLLDPKRRKRMGKSAQAQALATHTWSDHLVQLEDVYREVLEGRSILPAM